MKANKINNIEFLNLRQNNQLPIETRKIFDKNHMNAVKFMKIFYQQWNCGNESMKNNNLGTISKISKITNIPNKHIKIAMITWKIYLLRKFFKNNSLYINNDINHHNLFRELNISKKNIFKIKK